MAEQAIALMQFKYSFEPYSRTFPGIFEQRVGIGYASAAPPVTLITTSGISDQIGSELTDIMGRSKKMPVEIGGEFSPAGMTLRTKVRFGLADCGCSRTD